MYSKIIKTAALSIFGAMVVGVHSQPSAMLENHHMHDSVQVSAYTEHPAADTSVAKAEKAKLKPQSTCPVMGGKINKKLSAEHDGKRVYFCCGGCIATFKKDPVKYLGKLESMGQAAEVIKNETKLDKKSSASEHKSTHGSSESHSDHHQ